MVPGKEINLS